MERRWARADARASDGWDGCPPGRGTGRRTERVRVRDAEGRPGGGLRMESSRSRRARGRRQRSDGAGERTRDDASGDHRRRSSRGRRRASADASDARRHRGRARIRAAAIAPVTARGAAIFPVGDARATGVCRARTSGTSDDACRWGGRGNETTSEVFRGRAFAYFSTPPPRHDTSRATPWHSAQSSPTSGRLSCLPEANLSQRPGTRRTRRLPVSSRSFGALPQGGASPLWIPRPSLSADPSPLPPLPRIQACVAARRPQDKARFVVKCRAEAGDDERPEFNLCTSRRRRRVVLSRPCSTPPSSTSRATTPSTSQDSSCPR